VSIVRASFICPRAKYRRETRCQEVTGEIEVLRMRDSQLRSNGASRN